MPPDARDGTVSGGARGLLAVNHVQGRGCGRTCLGVVQLQVRAEERPDYGTGRGGFSALSTRKHAKGRSPARDGRSSGMMT